MNRPALDLATLPASSLQRRAALIALVAIGLLTIAALPFARHGLGSLNGFVALHGGAVLMGLAITAMILFGQFALARKPSTLALACGTLFCAIVYVPYVLTFPGVGSAIIPGDLHSTATYLWLVWHTALPASFVVYAYLARHEGSRRVDAAGATAAIVGSFVGAYAIVHLVFAFQDVLPTLNDHGVYRTPIYIALALSAAFAASALVMLLRRREPSVVEAWLLVPAGAILAESFLNAFGGARFTLAWYLSRIDILLATTFLVAVLLMATNRLARGLTHNELRLRGIVNGVADALVVVDARGAIASVNPAASTLFGFVSEDLAGTPISRIVPDFAAFGAGVEGVVAETVGRNARGDLFPIELARGRDIANDDLAETILILRDITHRKAAEDAIRAAHDRAVEAASVKSQFLATMSHEIRTPINAVVGMSELLLQTPLGDEAREYATTVRDSAESLLAIVNDILDFSKIEAGRMELDGAPFAPVVAVENATDILAAAARKKGLSLSTYVAPDVPARVIGDADRLRQVLLNLIGNAVKFTSQGSVTVRVVVERGEFERAVLRFSVTDTGPGIAPEVAERLFEPFRQADQSTRRRYGGTGLGLSISRRIVELMGGRIGFDASLGRGATFWFTVPFPRVANDAVVERNDRLRGARVLVIDEDAVSRGVVDQYLLAWGAIASSTGTVAHAIELAKAAAARGQQFDTIIIDRAAGGDAFALVHRIASEPVLEKVPLVLISGGEERITQQDARMRGFSAVLRKPMRQGALHEALVSAIHGPPPLAPTHTTADALIEQREGIVVLVAEDNPVNRKLALQQLKKLGYNANAVTDGREAVIAVAEGSYDLILMDCQMPEMDGFEATREIRRAETATGVHIPIVAMTANALEGDREACIAAGMDDYLAKPVQLAAMREVVERFTNGVGVAG